MRALLVLVLAGGIADACPQTNYVPRVGTLSHAASCGEWIATSDPAEIDQSIAAIRIRDRTPPEFTVAVRLQQLTPEPATIELQIPGGYLVLKEGGIGLYTTEAAWAEHGIEPLPRRRLTDAMTVRVRGHGDVIEAWIDGTLAGKWTLRTRPVTDMEVAIVGPGGRRARLWFTEVADTTR
jgi:hypothetical protein